MKKLVGWSRVDTRVSVFSVGGTALVVGLFFAFPHELWAQIPMVVVWISWAMIPPGYFLYEWSEFRHPTDSSEFDAMKYSHELASKFWLAGVGVLSAILFAAEFKL